jgi:hypothetical protein
MTNIEQFFTDISYIFDLPSSKKTNVQDSCTMPEIEQNSQDQKGS